MTENLLRTPLFDEHVAAGGRMVPFAGWEMPVQYSGVIPEVKAVREECGVFDVSHMVQYRVAGGPDGTSVLNGVVSADWASVPAGGAAYALLLAEDGGVLDDIMGYRDGEYWIIVGNAGRYEVDRPHLQAHLGEYFLGDERCAVAPGGSAILAIQGPKATHILGSLLAPGSPPLSWRTAAHVTLGGVGGFLVRGGYTGSDGYEFMFPAVDAVSVWRQLLAAGVLPCGLGARDVLRLEAGLPLYGHELREEWTPAESGVGFAFKPDKGQFLGRDAASRPAERKIVALQMEGKGIPREGYPVSLGGQQIGEITSGTMSPTIGIGIALASVAVSSGLAVGDAAEVLIRGGAHPARVVKRPFVPFAAR